MSDSIITRKNPAEKSLLGYKETKSMVYSGMFPIEGGDYENLIDVLGKLSLNDSYLNLIQEYSGALGFDFRCGFIGLIHMDIVKKRLMLFSSKLLCISSIF